MITEFEDQEQAKGLLIYICRQIINAMKKEEKYKWHDLRKNPDDLPEDTANVLIASEDGEKQVGYFCGECFAWKLYNPDHNLDWEYVDSEDAMVEVIAWREIEPFEEE